MGGTDKAIEALLSQDNLLGDKTLIATLQKNINAAGYTINYSTHKNDGVIGSKTCEDIVDYCRDNPEALITINPSLLQKIFEHKDFRQQLQKIVEGRPDLVHRIYAKVDETLKQKNLDQLNSAELKEVQARWALTGDYTKTIDGLNGSGTRGAYTKHRTGAGHTDTKIKEPTTTYATTETKPLLIIDAGHGAGHDKGAHHDHDGHHTHETYYIDPVAQALAEKMKAQGWDVAFTRSPFTTAESFLSNEARAHHALKLAEGRQHAVMLSVHADSNPAENFHGVGIYIASNVDLEQGDGKLDFGGTVLNPTSAALASSLKHSLKAHHRTHSHHVDHTLTQTFDSNSRFGLSAAVIELDNLQSPQGRRALEKIRSNPEAIAGRISEGLTNHYQRHQQIYAGVERPQWQLNT